jgi:RNA-directed DNA polymerase
VWILDAGLAAAFGKISHEHLLEMLGDFPAKAMIAGWLKAGIFEAGKGFAPTWEGTPQGGVIPPLLLNIALHGLEEAAGVRYRLSGIQAGEVKRGSPVLTRYADDLVVCCHSRQQAEEVKARLAGWLEPRGLAFNEAKTRIVSLSEGFDFLGFNLRRYPNGKLLIKPGAMGIKKVPGTACEGIPRTPRAQRRSGTGEDSPDRAGMGRLLPDGGIEQGIHCLTGYLWKLTYKRACWSHQNKPKRWIVDLRL